MSGPKAHAGAKAPTIGQALELARARGVERLDAQLLLLHAMAHPPGQPPHGRAWLQAHADEALALDAVHRFATLVERAALGEPLAYQIGERAFFGLVLRVDRRVLIPRADTETLVRWALELVDAARSSVPVPTRAIDLGTGSGAIALALKHMRPSLLVAAIDASEEALCVARDNASRLGLDVAFAVGNWLEGVHQSYDLIVSNPPYVAQNDRHLDQLRHEPQRALVSGTDGLDDLRAIIGQARARLTPTGWLVVEHGYDQGPAVRQLFLANGFALVTTRRDLEGQERCTGGQTK